MVHVLSVDVFSIIFPIALRPYLFNQLDEDDDKDDDDSSSSSSLK